MLVDGQWTTDWHPVQAKDEAGRFVRQRSSFRHWVTPDGRPGPTGEGGFAAEPGRYHLYVALICPWASRTLAMRALKGLEDVIGVTVVRPELTSRGWRFGDGHDGEPDPLAGATWLYERYVDADPKYTGRATVPVLWDTARDTMVNNESADILRMLGSAFDGFARGPLAGLDPYPAALRPAIDALADRMYATLNNGVYRAGFASSQAAYDEAVEGVFAMLGELESRLADGRPFLFGEQLTEADIRLFVTTIRFDLAYHGLFKTNRARLADHPRLLEHTRRVYQLPGVAGTVSVDHIKRGYYSIEALNPSGIVPAGPDLPPWLAA